MVVLWTGIMLVAVPPDRPVLFGVVITVGLILARLLAELIAPKPFRRRLEVFLLAGLVLFFFFVLGQAVQSVE